LQLKPNSNVIDGTLGGGGHTCAILERTAPNGIVVGFDRDRDTLQNTSKLLQEFGERFVPIHDSYANITEYADALQRAQPLDGILLDLGLSSFQMDSPDRGFSYRFESPLDMRFDTTRGETAADLLNSQSEEALRNIFRQYGEVQRANALARVVVERRAAQPFVTTLDLLAAVEQVSGGWQRRSLHPATQVFQALRIAVNHELDQLEQFLPVALTVLASGGRLAVISFHSLEDRIVKQFMVDSMRDCVCPPEFPECRCDHRAVAKRVTKKPIIPTPEEIAQNPRSRSAKLRIIEKI
jgi:16S rRNA (cytosine1402-N4)-methyltransferase